MRQLIVLILTIVFFTDSFSQADSSRINKIRKIVQQINKDTSDGNALYETITLNNGEFMTEYMTDGGGQLSGYFKNGHLVKMVERIGLSSCVNTTEFYLKDNKLIFTYIQGKEFKYVDSLATFNSSIQTVTMECRFYFYKDKMIKSILTGSTRCGGEPSDSWAKMCLNTCAEYIETFKEKKK